MIERVFEEHVEKMKGFSGADIENLVNECGYSAITNLRGQIEIKDFEESVEKVFNQKIR